MYNIKESVKEETRLGKPYVTVNTEGKVDDIAFLTISYSKPHFVPPITSSEIDGVQKFGFDVTSDGFKPLNGVSMQTSDFLTFMKNLTAALVQCDDHFMNPFNFLVTEEFVYVNPNSFDVRIIYLPILSSLYSEEEVNRHVYEIARTISRRFSEQSDDWKDVISKMWSMSETASVFEANSIYAALCNELKEQSDRKNVAHNKKNEAIAVEQSHAIPVDLPPIAEPKKKSMGLFGSKKEKKVAAVKEKDEKPAKKGWLSKEKEPKPPKPPKKGLFGSSKESKPPKSSIFGSKKDKSAGSSVADEKTEAFLPDEYASKPSAILHLMEHGTKASSVAIEKEVFLIGRNRHDVDYCFMDEQDKLISRIHVQISFDGTQYYVMDKGSMGGTLLNNVKLEPNKATVLGNGSIIKLGQRELLFELS